MNSYEKFQERLDTLPVSTPSTESKVEIEIFKRLMSEDEAGIASHLTGQPENIQSLSQRVGMDPEKLTPILDSLAIRGVIFKVVVGPEPLYCLVSVVPGIWEFQVHRRDPELVKLFENYFYEKLGTAIHSNELPWMRVIPIKESIDANTRILTYEEVEKLIDASPTICLTDCVCRTHHHEIGHGCSYPLEDMCMFLTPWAEFYIETGRGRKATREEAKNTLKKAEESGLIHTTINAQNNVIAVCNCCSCCCLILRGITELRIPTSIATSNFIVEFAEEMCSGCGICVDRCQMGAFELTDDDATVTFHVERCIGCGACVTTCPTGALELIRRSDEIEPPVDVESLMGTIEAGRKND